MTEKETVPGEIELDRFVGASAPVQVMLVEQGGLQVPSAQDPTRKPHRHDYHELFIVEHGTTLHRIDADEVTIGACEAVMIGRGQVHTLLRADDFSGAVVRFGEALLTGATQHAAPGWSLVATRTDPVRPPRRELEHALAVLRLLADELQRPRDASTDQLVTSTLTTVLGLVQRWQSDTVRETPASVTDPDVALLRRFSRILEGSFTEHHDAAWYAAQLGISTNHLAATLTKLTGQSTKRLITDRLMTEVERLLRFTDMSVQQIAYRLGYTDPLYLSRAFKVHVGDSPSNWRKQHVVDT